MNSRGKTALLSVAVVRDRQRIGARLGLDAARASGDDGDAAGESEEVCE